MRLVEVLATLRRHIRFVAVAAVLGLVTGGLLAAMQSSSYEATARIAIGPDNDIADQNDRIQAGHVLNQAIIPSNLSELLVSERVLTTALAETDLSPIDVEEDKIEAVVAPDSNIVYLSIASSEAGHPEKLLGPITAAGIVLFEDIYDVYRAEVIQLDQVAEEKPPIGLLAGSAIGLLFGLLVATYLVLLIDRKLAGSVSWIGGKPPPPIHQGSQTARQQTASSTTRRPDSGDLSAQRPPRPAAKVSASDVPLLPEQYRTRPTVAQLAATTGEYDLSDIPKQQGFRSASNREPRRNGSDGATDDP